MTRGGGIRETVVEVGKTGVEVEKTGAGAGAGKTGVGVRTTGSPGESGDPRAANPPLEPGRLIQGKVLSFSADGRVVLQLAGQQIVARSAIPLTPGQEFWFEVRQGSAGLQLALADKQGAMYRFLQQAMGGLRDLGHLNELLGSLKQWPTGALPTEMAEQLARLTLGSSPAPEKIIQLLSWLNADGSGHQGKSATSLAAQLQALLVAMRQTQRQAQARSYQGIHEIMNVMSRISGVLEAMVGMNEQPAPPQQSSFWLFPCFFSLGAGGGSWLFSRQAQLVDDQESSSLVFFLEMSRLGELQLQVKQRGNRLDGDFVLAETAAAEFLQGRLEELRQRLEKLGYQATFRCRGGATPLLSAIKDALEKAICVAPRKLVDIKA
ncbi:MAG: flagellar hook-length control protein FliK [Desulfobulbaceae bacterium]|nr:MAG: flagellar hook-length control protein FliK [Desulfobulbaceae bacterium]